MLSAFQVKVRSSNQTLTRIAKRDDTKNNLKEKKKHKRQSRKTSKKLMLIICLLLIFLFLKKKKIDFNAWNVFWSGSTKKITLF